MTKKEWATNNIEKVRAYRAKWAKDNPSKERERKRRWELINREKERVRKRKWEKENPEKVRQMYLNRVAKNPEKEKERVKAWNKSHPGSMMARVRKYRLLHPERLKTSTRKYREANPGVAKICHHNRKARKADNGGRLSIGLPSKLMLLQKNKCAICKTNLLKSGHHIDHIFPLSLGGKNDDRNIQLTCPKCNLKKGAKDPIVFMSEMGYLL
jgi:5-methylcytosine-specific restriction endonuclease McrA